MRCKYYLPDRADVVLINSRGIDSSEFEVADFIIKP